MEAGRDELLERTGRHVGLDKNGLLMEAAKQTRPAFANVVQRGRGAGARAAEGDNTQVPREPIHPC